MLPGCCNPNIILNVAAYMLCVPLLVARVGAAMEIEELINNLLHHGFAVIVQRSRSWIKTVRAQDPTGELVQLAQISLLYQERRQS